MAKTRSKSSIDTTQVVTALFELISNGAEFGIDDVVIRANIVEKDVPALKQKFKMWHDGSIILRQKDKETGEVKERQNKPLNQKRVWANFIRGFITEKTGSHPTETVVGRVGDNLYSKLEPHLVKMASTSSRDIKLDSGLVDLIGDVLGDDYFENNGFVVVDDDYDEDE